MNNTDVIERGKTMGIWTLEKYDLSPISRIQAPTPDEVLQFNALNEPIDTQSFKNLLTNAGAAIIEDLLIGAGGTVFSNANAYIGVGDSSTAVSAAHTDLQAATNKLRVAMDATFPSRASQTLTFKSTFSTSQANWVWNEMAAFNASSAGTMLNRALVSSPFTKTSSLSVVATLTWTVS